MKNLGDITAHFRTPWLLLMVLVGVSQEEANLTEHKAKQCLIRLHRFAQKNKDAKQELENMLAG